MANSTVADILKAYGHPEVVLGALKSFRDFWLNRINANAEYAAERFADAAKAQDWLKTHQWTRIHPEPFWQREFATHVEDVKYYTSKGEEYLAKAAEAQIQADDFGRELAQRTVGKSGPYAAGYLTQAVNWVAENPWTAGGIGLGVAGAVALAYHFFRKGDKKAAQKVLEADIKSIKSETMQQLKHITVPRADFNAEGKRFAHAAEKSQTSMSKAKALVAKVGGSRATTEDLERATKQIKVAQRDAASVVKTASASQTMITGHSASRRAKHAVTPRAHVPMQEKTTSTHSRRSAQSSSAKKATTSSHHRSGKSTLRKR